MNTKFLAYGFAIACTLASCGDDSSTGPSTNSSGVSQLSSSSAAINPTSTTTESSDSKENSSDSNGYSSSSQETSANSNGYPANYDPTTNTLTDERDGEIYKTAKVGEQIWMAENLRTNKANYDDTCAPNEDEPQKAESVIKKFGRYYTWINAMQLCEYRYKWAAASETDSVYHGPRQGLCPKGWHVPSTSEWQTLLDQGPVKKLLSTEWDYVNYKGTDDYGFSLTVPTEK